MILGLCLEIWWKLAHYLAEKRFVRGSGLGGGGRSRVWFFSKLRDGVKQIKNRRGGGGVGGRFGKFRFLLLMMQKFII